MNFDHLDDSDPFVADEMLRHNVHASGEHRRKRDRRFRLMFSTCTALVFVASILGFGAWTNSRVERVHVGFTAPPVDLSRPFTVLLIGSDRQTGDAAMSDNADAVMVVRIDPTASRISVLSIPRDLAIEGAEGPRVAELLRGDPARLAEAIQRELGVPLSSYVGISFDGLVKLADAFGGLEVAINQDLADPLSGLDLQASTCMRLTGEQLLAALRSRRPVTLSESGPITDVTSDAGRRNRQRALISILFDQLHRLTTTPNSLDRILDIAISDLEVDDRIDLATMMAIGRWFAANTADVFVDDLPTEWTTAQNQRRVLTLTPQSSPKILALTNDALVISSGTATSDGSLQPFESCP